MSVTHFVNAKGDTMPNLEASEETPTTNTGNGFVKDFSMVDDGNSDDATPARTYGPKSTVDEDTSNAFDDEPDSTEGDENVVDEHSDDENEDDEQSQDPISTDLLLRAGALGVPVDQVKFYGEQGDSVFEQHLDNYESNNTVQNKTEQEGEGGNKSIEAYTLEFDDDGEDEIDPEIRKAIEGVNQHYAEGLKEARKTSENIGQAVVNYHDNQLYAEVNEEIDGLGDEFETLLGAGTDGLVDTGSVASKNRNAVMDEIYAIQNARKKSGQPGMTTKRAFAEAVNKVTGKSIDKTTQTTQKKLARRSRTATPKTGRKTVTNATGNGEAKAAQRWNQAISG